MDLSLQRKNMVESQVRPSDVTDRRIITAMQQVPREAFVPAELQAIAYLDTPLGIAPGRSVLPPRLFAKLIQLAALEPTDTVLDVGAAGGYSTAVLAQIAGKVIALESDEFLAKSAQKNLAQLQIANASVQISSLTRGYPEGSPYDVIVLEGAVDAVPQDLLNQLSPTGRLVGVQVKGALGSAITVRRAGEKFDTLIAFEAWADSLPGFQTAKVFAL